MQASAVVKHLYEIEDGLSCFVSGFEVAAVDQFLLEGAPERFHGGIVVAVAFAAHGSDGLCVLQRLPVVVTGVLDAAVGMKHQAGGGLTMSQGHAPGGQNQFGGHVDRK